MKSSDLIFSHSREWNEIKDEKTVHFLLNEYINYKSLIINLFPIEIELKFYKLKHDNSYLFQYDKTVEFHRKYIETYMSISKQLIFQFTLLNQFPEKKIIHCKLTSVLISKKNRKYKRFPINHDEVIIEKFVFFKENNYEINLEQVLNSLQKEHSIQVRDRFPSSKIYKINDKSLNLEFELDYLKRKKTPIHFNTDEQNLILDDILPVKNIFENEEIFINQLYEYNSRNINNFLFYPILSFFSGEKNIYFYAYAQNLSIVQYIDLIEIYKDLEKSLNQEIISNSTQIKLQQRIINISLGGFLLEITEKILIDYFLKIIFFSTLFLLKNKIRIESIAEVKHIRKIGHRYIIGFEFLYPCFKKSHLELLQRKSLKNELFIKSAL